MNTTGTSTFSGAVGDTAPLTSLTTNAGGTTAVNGGSVATSGNQTYNDNVTMNQATTLTSTGGAITFGGNATNSAAGAGITVDAPTINLTGGTTIATTGNGPSASSPIRSIPTEQASTQAPAHSPWRPTF